MPSTLYVWSCSQGGSIASEVTPLNTSRPTCPNGQGSYVQVNVADMTITSAVNWDEVVWASAACLLMWVVGIGFGMVWKHMHKRGF